MSEDWRTLYKSGYVARQAKLSKVRRGAKAAAFLDRVVDEFARTSRKYCELTGELPFIYRERQVNSVLLPAIARVADAALAETPVVRHHEQGSGHGWVDYWASYEQVDFYIELKHGWYAAASYQVRQATTDAWHALDEQLASLPADLSNYTLSGQALKVALLVVPCYRGSQDGDKLEPLDYNGAVAIWRLVRDQLKDPAPNWSSVWHLHEKLQVPQSYEGWHELYPCVVFAAHVVAAD